jgi:hypothetical protein
MSDLSKIIDRETIEQLRSIGYVIVPLAASNEMKAIGAPNCFLVPGGTMEIALRDAEECYRAMIELGCL